METELQLLNAIKSGEREAKRRLYERYSGYAMATALRYVPDPDEVRDVMQDSFVRILTTIDRFSYRGEGSLKAWVTSIVTHRAIDHIKEHERIVFVEHLTNEPETEEEPDVGRVPPDVLTRLIGQLPAGCRTVLNLYVFEQLPHKEIARLLGVKPETSAAQYSRAKKTLARLIKNYQKTHEQ